MELFRHYFTPQEWATSVFFQQHLNDFGFCHLDGSMITNTWNDTDFKARYKYDSRGEVTIAAQGNNWTGYSPGCHPWLSDGGGGRHYYYPMHGGAAAPCTIIFIPLINKGFLLHLRAHDPYGDSYDLNNVINDSRQMDKTFALNTPTPNLNIRVYSNSSQLCLNDSQYGRYAGYGVCTFIGLPPSSGNPNYWTYLEYTRNASLNDTGTGEPPFYAHNLIDYGNGRVTDMPFRSEYIRNETVSNESSIYTNVNPNVCALIKMPFDTGYIDNLYLLATAPKALTDATFFSFNGRNFLNVFDNYVVELPSTTS